MADFKPVYEKTKQWEGGYQSNPNDKANYNSLGQLVGTKYGISAVGYESWLKRPPTLSEMQSIDRPTSRKILKTRYWDVIRGDEIKSQDVAEIIFGTYIGNQVNTNKALQSALNSFGITNIKVGWNYSDDLIKIINKINPEKLFYAIKEAQVQYILLPMKQSGSTFYAGWSRKVESFEYEGNKKKWLLTTVIVIVLITASYIAYKKEYHKKINFK